MTLTSGVEPCSAASPRSEARGTTFSRYRIEGELARGGMGAILEVWDDDLRRRLAMKVALDGGTPGSTSSATTSPKLVARFLEEAQVTGQLEQVRGGQQVRLDSMATVTLGPGPVSVARQSQLPAVTITFNLAPGYTLGEAVAAMRDLEREVKMPATITGQFAGTAQVFESSFRDQPLLDAREMHFDDRAHRFAVRKPDVVKKASPQKSVGQFFFIV